MANPVKESSNFAKSFDSHSTIREVEAFPSALGMERFQVTIGQYRDPQYQFLIRLKLYFSSEQKASYVFKNILPNLLQIIEHVSGKLNENTISLFVDYRTLMENGQPTELMKQIQQLSKCVFSPHQIKEEVRMVWQMGVDLKYYPDTTLKLKYDESKYFFHKVSQKEMEIFSQYKEGDEINLKSLFPNRKWAPAYESVIQQNDRMIIEKIYRPRWDYQDRIEVGMTNEKWANGSQEKLTQAIQNLKLTKQEELDQSEKFSQNINSKILPEENP